MRFIDPHIHMTARTTDDYERMAAAGIVAVIEPAFWLGQPRTNVGSFIDYCRAWSAGSASAPSQFGIRHYCTIGLNSKEANNEALAEAVLDVLPRYLAKEGVVAVGEIGYDDQTAAEDKYYRAQLAAGEGARPAGAWCTRRTATRSAAPRAAWTWRSRWASIPGRVVIDHNNEETVREVLDRGFWAASRSTRTPRWATSAWWRSRASYGSERIFIDSSADWGVSDPLAVPKTARLMLERGIPREDVEAICYGNALAAYGQSGQMQESDWLAPQPIDQRELFEGNSVLRGQAPRVDGLPVIPERVENALIEVNGPAGPATQEQDT